MNAFVFEVFYYRKLYREERLRREFVIFGVGFLLLWFDVCDFGIDNICNSYYCLLSVYEFCFLVIFEARRVVV